MELAIRIIVVLFVAFAVGGLLVVFSRNILQDASQELKTVNDGKDVQNTIVRLDAATANDLINLANACIAQQHGVAMEPTVCFAVFATSYEWPSRGSQLSQGFTFETIGAPTRGGVLLVFDPFQSKVVVRTG